VLQGIQGVQGQIPYVSELRDLAPDSAELAALAAVDRAIAICHGELSDRLEGKLGALAASGEHAWLEQDDATIYFEFEALPGYSCEVRRAARERDCARAYALPRAAAAAARPPRTRRFRRPPCPGKPPLTHPRSRSRSRPPAPRPVSPSGRAPRSSSRKSTLAKSC
jgi:hypothetical protein